MMDFSTVGKTTDEKAKDGASPRSAGVLIMHFPTTDIIENQFEEVLANFDEVVKKSEEIEVKDDDSVKLAIETAGTAKKIFKAVDEVRKKINEKPSSFITSVNNMAKEFTSKLSQIEQTLKRKIGNFQYQQELKRQAEEKKLKEEQEELQKRLDAEAKEKGLDRVEVAPVVVPKAETVQRSSTHASHIRKKWKGRVLKADDVPRKYCSPDPKKIQEAIDHGLRKMKGVEIFEDISTVIR